MMLPSNLDATAVAIASVEKLTADLIEDIPSARRVTDASDEGAEASHSSDEVLGRALDSHGAALAEATQIFRTRAVLLAAAAHDAKGPLAAISGYSQILRAHPELDAETAATMLDAIFTSVQRLDDLLVELARVNEWLDGRAAPEGAPTDLGDLLARAASSTLGAAHPSTVEVSTGLVTVDDARLTRIVENLLINVTRHTPPGTSVWIRAEAAPGGLLIGVDDSGPGIPPSRRAELMRHQSKPQATSGIGLTIVRTLTESLGGRAWIEARPGGGSAFRVWIPAPPKTETTETSETAGASSPDHRNADLSPTH